MAHKLYLYLIHAQADASISQRHKGLLTGKNYAMNCFAVDGDIEQAQKSVSNILSKFGWKNIEFIQSKEVPQKLSAIPDKQLQELAKTAGRKGFAYHVYSSPIE